MYCIYGTFLDNFLEHFWNIFGTFSVHVWNLFGTFFVTFLEHVLEHFWNIFATFLEHFWDIFGTCSKNESNPPTHDPFRDLAERLECPEQTP